VTLVLLAIVLLHPLTALALRNASWVGVVRGSAIIPLPDLNRPDPSSLRLWAEAATLMGDDSGMLAWNRAVELSSDPLIRVKRGMLLAVIGRTEDASADWLAVGATGQTLYGSSERATVLGQRTMSVALLIAAVRAYVGPLTARQFLIASDRLEQAGERDIAEGALNRAAEASVQDPRSAAVALVRIGTLHREKGNSSLAEEVLTCAIAVDPLYSPAFFALGNLAMSRRDCAAALDYFRRGAAPGTTEPGPNVGLGFVLMQLGRLDEAKDQLVGVVGAVPNSADARFRLAQALLLGGDRTDALRQVNAALELKPTISEYRRLRDGILAGDGTVDTGVCVR